VLAKETNVVLNIPKSVNGPPIQSFAKSVQ
jgi:hypothetical protein